MWFCTYSLFIYSILHSSCLNIYLCFIHFIFIHLSLSSNDKISSRSTIFIFVYKMHGMNQWLKHKAKKKHSIRHTHTHPEIDRKKEKNRNMRASKRIRHAGDIQTNIFHCFCTLFFPFFSPAFPMFVCVFIVKVSRRWFFFSSSSKGFLLLHFENHLFWFVCVSFAFYSFFNSFFEWGKNRNEIKLRFLDFLLVSALFNQTVCCHGKIHDNR